MSPLALALTFIVAVIITLIVLNERIGLFAAADHFSSPLAKGLAYGWLALFMLLLTVQITASAQNPMTAQQLANTPFYALFGLHIVLVIFLAGWWLLSGRPNLGQFFNIKRDGVGNAVLTGAAVGLGGWVVTIAAAFLIALIVTRLGIMPKNPKPPAAIAFIAAMPVWKKIAIVFSAMTVEELFYRGWLQKRVGLIASTLLFALSHSGFGQPLLLVGVFVISTIIGTAFYRTKNLIPGVIAHGVFDAVQLFVIIPIVFKATGIGG